MDISRRRSARGGDILILAPGLTSLVVVRRMVGIFFFFFFTRQKMDIFRRRSERSGEITLLAIGWTSFVIALCVVGKFSYSPQAGLLSSSFGAWRGDCISRPRRDTSHHRSACRGEILLLAPRWTTLVVV